MSYTNHDTGSPRPAPPKKTRQFSCISYLTEEQIHYCLQRKREYIRHWAYIRHDKDVKDDGTPKESHYHILVWTYSPTTTNSIRRWFKVDGVEANTLSQAVISSDDIIDYLTHDGSPDKYQYPESDIVSDDWEWFKTADDENPSYQCLMDMLAGAPLLDLAKTYGREFIINFSKYSDLASAIHTQEAREKINALDGEATEHYFGNPMSKVPEHYRRR